MGTPTALDALFDLLPLPAAVKGPSAAQHDHATLLLDAAGFLSAAELAHILNLSEAHAQQCIDRYWDSHPEAWNREVQRRRDAARA